MLKNLAKHALAKQISESKFTFLEIKSASEHGSSVSVDGDLYGIVGALGIFIMDICNQANMPCEDFVTMLGLACEIATESDEEANGIDMEQFLGMLNADKEEDN